jgi:16S rRNA (adenine1518-N6/adenine1519-N6)-dimethyltransferase
MSKLLSTAELVKKYQLDSKKSLGQNFIFDKNFTDKIVRSTFGNANDLSDYEILEIGGGPGSLSRSILDAGAKKLTIIEKDRRCILALQELKNFYGNRLEIIEGDALEIIEDDNLQGNFNKLFGDKQFKIIANLPYNIGTPLLFKFLNFRKQIISMHLMLQKEVVQRIVAKANEDHYGRLAVMVNFLCNTKMLFTVDKNVFTPPPKITSAIVEIIPKSEIDEKVDLKKLQKVVAFAFNQRRKMIKSALKNVFFEKTVEILESCNINPQDRAEQLSIADFCNLAKNLNDN